MASCSRGHRESHIDTRVAPAQISAPFPNRIPPKGGEARGEGAEIRFRVCRSGGPALESLEFEFRSLLGMETGATASVNATDFQQADDQAKAWYLPIGRSSPRSAASRRQTAPASVGSGRRDRGRIRPNLQRLQRILQRWFPSICVTPWRHNRLWNPVRVPPPPIDTASRTPHLSSISCASIT